MKHKINRFIEWYHVNLGKIVFLFILIVVLELLFIHIPFINIILSSLLNIIIILTFWGILLKPSVKLLVFIALFVLLIDVELTLFKLDTFAEPLGNIFYFLLIFICINYAKEIFQTYNKKG